MERNRNEPLERFTAGEIAYREAEDGEKDSRQVILSLSSEEPYLRYFGNEILCHDAGAIDLTRLQELGVVLFNHNADCVLGRVVSVELDEAQHKLRAVVQFDDDEASEKIYQKVKNGTLKGVSVGYHVSVWEEVEAGAVSSNGRFTGPCCVATSWEPLELSIVSVPADPTVGVGRNYQGQQNKENGERNMKNQNQNGEIIAPENNGTPPEDERQAGIQAERQRVQDITGLCRQFDVEPETFIKEGKSVEECRAAILEKLAGQRKPQNITIQADEMDKFRAAAVDGLALRAGVQMEKPAAGATEFQGKNMLRLAAECIERETGKHTRNMDDMELVREALTGTGAFPGILSNVANKSMMQAYQTAPTTYQLWTAKGSNSDFKEATRYRLGEADDLVKVNENGEFQAGTVSEGAAKTSIATYGRTFSLTRQAIINDDMGALKNLPNIYGAAARRMVNKMVYKVLLDNPTIEDKKLFTTDRNNLNASTDLTVAGLGAMKANMAKQTNIGGEEKLNIQPAFLIVPVELEVQAAQLINSVVDPSKSNATVNPFANKLTVISDPELTEADAFYLAAAAGYAPTIEVTTLNGVEAPVMESAVQFDTLGIKWRIYLDVGVNLLDFRGIQKATK